MDLGSLLNQGAEGLSLRDLRILLDESESSVKLNRITNPSFTFPNALYDTYAFFDVFIQVLLSIDYTDEQFGSQYTKTIVIEALRSCVNGLLQQNGLSWLVHFSSHLSMDTWHKLENSKTDTTILVYLYGLVLPLLASQENVSADDWAQSLVQFIKTKSSALICHIWMNLWSVDDNNTRQNSNTTTIHFYKMLENHQQQQHETMDACLVDFITLLKTRKTDILSHIDQQLGRVLWRSSFTEDEFVLAYAKVEMMSTELYSTYPNVCHVLQRLVHRPRPEAKNPLVTNILLKRMASDPMVKMNNLQKATKLWMECARTLSDTEFALYLQDLIKGHYPTDRKIMLDGIIAYWAIRDPFEKHSGIILDAIIELLRSSTYNLRSSPYYAFMEYFQGWPNDAGNEEGGYNVTTGAVIDISSFSGYKNAKLHRGCCRMLERLTSFMDVAARDWMSDCLEVATPDIVKWYAEWLCGQLNAEMAVWKKPLPQKKKKGGNRGSSEVPPKFGKYMHSMVQNPRVVSLGLDVVPTMLRTLNDASLEFLLGYPRNFTDLLIQYFGGFPQLSTEVLVTDLVKTKSKKYLDLLLGCLRKNMSDTKQASSKSRAWFSEHFVGSILSAAGDDTDGNSVASQLFRQILKTRGDFDFYLATPLLPEDEEDRPPAAFQRLDIAKNHTILWVQHIGLISLLHEMVRLRDRERIERLVTTWRGLWVTPNQGFTVPMSWILKCIGLYDKAPALVKQMIHDFMRNGIRQDMRDHKENHVPGLLQAASSTTDRFITRVIDLLMLGDVSEVDTIFDLFLWLYEAETAASQPLHNHRSQDDEIIFEIVSIILQLGEELKLADVEGVVQLQQTKRERQSKKQKQPQKLKNHQQLQNMQLGEKWVHKKKQRKRYNQRDQQRHHHQEGQQQEQKQAVSQAVGLQTKTGPREILMVLVQRTISFLALLLGEEPGESPVKQTLRTKLLEQPLLYEGLRTLREAIKNPSDDLVSLIDLSCETLQAQQKTALLSQAQTILAQ